MGGTTTPVDGAEATQGEPDAVAAVTDESREEKKQRGKREKLAKKQAEMRKKALDGRISGMTWRQAAEYAGYGSGASAYNACKAEIAAIPRESAKELLAVELETLSMVQLSAVKPARQGDPASQAIILRVIDQRAKLTGLYEYEQDDSASGDVKGALLSFLQSAREINEERKAQLRAESGETVAEQDAASAEREQALL